jgi:hypothetical protein
MAHHGAGIHFTIAKPYMTISILPIGLTYRLLAALRERAQ